MQDQPTPLSERFVILSLAQALLRKGYDIQADHRMPNGREVDLLVQKPQGRSRFIVEVKVVNSASRVRQSANAARQQLSRFTSASIRGFVAIGISGTETVFADPELISLIGGSSSDMDLHPLPPAAGDA